MEHGKVNSVMKAGAAPGLYSLGGVGGLQVKAGKARELGESSDSEKTCFKDNLYVVLVVQPSENSGSPKPPDSLVHEH